MRTFRAILSGRNEVPPVRTIASGNAVFQLSRNRTQLRFRLVIRNINRVTQAHIHLGRRGQNGPIVAFLFGPSKFGISVRRGVIRGVLTSRDLIGPLKGKTIRDLIREIERGNAYVNVHTIQFPDGEIRGQITRE
ncbi:CHRD domain-containing protein [Paenibacillus melissococcoides]|uniref:CHRD domain-containing protein n=1 Tax=Paenibacillus melissococcoides TaxID=2912268 RepID=A0ABN8UF45_9BACL|nr:MULTISPECIES: CHRD domain-containing protein [Paenibacillus]MEB9892472.1 CHRD domain-containing protein [Bacillus cereus]CAH8248271.1 CHRD domain-containing protein [Paenibacillus melissococcoides]CAH8717981.1 CHRD domain-containing protein [Paenibacillus melissococcoides]CAH8719141.1 CHRD domain-containing protein [Paenibacillus melissococcoides]